MAKQRKLLTDIKSDLPTPEKVNEITKKLSITNEATTGTANEKTVHTEGGNIKASQKSEAKPEQQKRVKFTTALNAEIIDSLKIRAIQEKKQPNEIIESLLIKYLKTEIKQK